LAIFAGIDDGCAVQGKVVSCLERDLPFGIVNTDGRNGIQCGAVILAAAVGTLLASNFYRCKNCLSIQGF